MNETAQVYVFDDGVADGWHPYALTRPIGELPFGRWRTRERVELATRIRANGHITRPWLARFTEPGAPPVVAASSIGSETPRLFWSSRAIPHPRAVIETTPGNLFIAGRLAGVVLAAGAPGPTGGWFADPTPDPAVADREVEGEWMDAIWDVVSRGSDRLRVDLESALAGADGGPGVDLPAGVHRVGDAPVRLAPGVVLEPGVLLDTTNGPIELSAGVEVRLGARLAGPLYAGEGTRLLGGSISSLSAGPQSNLRGEIEEVTVVGFCNKAHDGFLGHAVLGAWVNLGAMTTNSDLKNNYGTVRVGPPESTVDTGLIKIGCLMGDHVKTGIGTLINTGSIIGAGSNLFGAEMPPKWVPPFSWGQGVRLTEYRRDAFLSTAATVLPRRGVEADEGVLGWLGDVWDAARK